MVAKYQRSIAMAAVSGIVLTAGCVMLDARLKDAPTGIPVQAAAAWQPYVVFASDPTREGASTPGLVGRLYIFGAQADVPIVASGKIQVRLYPDAPGAKPTDPPLEIWNFDATTLKGKLQHDPIGWGYSLQLPWGTYQPDLTHVRLTVRFEPEKGGPPLYAQETHLSLHGQGPPEVLSTTAAVGTEKPQQTVKR